MATLSDSAGNGSSRAARTGIARDRYLWLLAAIFGAATVHAIATVVHDTSRRREAALFVTRATAERLVDEASRRLEAAAILALAPAMRMTAPGAPVGRGRAVVEELRREHELGLQCDCRQMMPVDGFFRFDIRDGTLDIAETSDSTRFVSAPIVSSIGPISRAEAGAVAAGDTRQVHLWTQGGLGEYTAVSAVPRDASGRATSVVGIVAPRRALVAWAFESALHPPPGDGLRISLPDSTSIQVRDAAGAVIAGALGKELRFRVSLTPRGVLEGLTVEVGLVPRQISGPLLAPVAERQVWHLMALLLATVLVLVLAGRASRREAMLARARSDFVAAVSHELRMPLAQILLASETLAMHRERSDADRTTLASSIVREARRLIALVENVLLFSRTGAVELRPHLAPVAVGELFDDVLEAVQLAADDAGHTIEIGPPPAVSVRADRALLRQALVNLIDNAMKYGGAKQTIRMSAEQMSSGRVRITVADEGRGVPYAERAKVFEPYERLGRDQASERTGTGLGLAVVRQIVTACGGRVWLDGGDEGGTRAIIELASAAAPAAAPSASETIP
jgi:signal transduction histidine kinase